MESKTISHEEMVNLILNALLALDEQPTFSINILMDCLRNIAMHCNISHTKFKETIIKMMHHVSEQEWEDEMSKVRVINEKE
jgi:hypothetical protein